MNEVEASDLREVIAAFLASKASDTIENGYRDDADDLIEQLHSHGYLA